MILYGICQIIVEGTILSKFRMFLLGKSKFLFTLITCMICTGFWVGVIISLLYFSPTKQWLSNENFILDGFFSSAIVWHIHLFENLFVNDEK